MAKSKAGRKPSKPPSSRGLKRAKKSAPRKGSPLPPPEEFGENALHLHACQWLRKHIFGLLIFHVPNGEHRHIAVAKKLQRMGVLPGVADFLCFTSSRKIAIELKDQDGEQSKDQEKFETRWQKIGGEYHLCRTLEDFKQLVTGIMLFG
jgi:hypothetical protein